MNGSKTFATFLNFNVIVRNNNGCSYVAKIDQGFAQTTKINRNQWTKKQLLFCCYFVFVEEKCGQGYRPYLQQFAGFPSRKLCIFSQLQVLRYEVGGESFEHVRLKSLDAVKIKSKVCESLQITDRDVDLTRSKNRWLLRFTEFMS